MHFIQFITGERPFGNLGQHQLDWIQHTIDSPAPEPGSGGRRVVSYAGAAGAAGAASAASGTRAADGTMAAGGTKAGGASSGGTKAGGAASGGTKAGGATVSSFLHVKSHNSEISESLSCYSTSNSEPPNHINIDCN